MSVGINRVVLIGNLTADCEAIGDTDGARFRVANNVRVKRNDEWQDYANFLDVVYWRADNLRQYLTKGRAVAIDGQLRHERWETQDGDKRSAVRIYADSVQLVGGRGEGGGRREDSPEPDPAEAPAGGASDDDIPF